MTLSFIILLLSFADADVDTSVARRVEALVHSRTNAVHEIEYKSVPRELASIDARSTVRVVDEPRAAYRGTFSVPVEVTVRGGAGRRYMLGIRVRTFESVAVAASMIDRHQVLGRAQIVMQNIETTQMNGSLVTDAGIVTGMRSRHIIAAGKVITRSMLEPMPMIASGSPVTVCVRRENVTLSVSGTAKNDGWHGSIIPVEVNAFRQHLTAKVVDATNVEVVEK